MLSADADRRRRDDLVHLLARIRPADAEEAAHRRFAAEWVAGGSALYRAGGPDVPETHLVSYFAVVDLPGRRLLLVDHLRARRWLATGGHVEEDDADPWATVRRECPEELFIDAEPLAATGTRPFFVSVARTYGPHPHTDVSLWYAVRGDPALVRRYDEREFGGIRWATPEEILATPADALGPHLRRAVRKLFPIVGAPAAGADGGT